MKESLLVFLRALDEAFPLPDGQHHGILRFQYGNEEGGSERLGLVMPLNGQSQIFFFDDGDIENPLQSIARLQDLILSRAKVVES